MYCYEGLLCTKIHKWSLLVSMYLKDDFVLFKMVGHECFIDFFNSRLIDVQCFYSKYQFTSRILSTGCGIMIIYRYISIGYYQQFIAIWCHIMIPHFLFYKYRPYALHEWCLHLLSYAQIIIRYRFASWYLSISLRSSEWISIHRDICFCNMNQWNQIRIEVELSIILAILEHRSR